MYSRARGLQVVVNAHYFETETPERRSGDVAVAWYATCTCRTEVNLRLR